MRSQSEVQSGDRRDDLRVVTPTAIREVVGSLTPAIECIALGKTLRRRSVLRDVSFAVEPGQICGFLGPNGAGKTTTIRTLLGLLRPSTGAVRVLGNEPPLSAHDARRVGFMFEQPAFYPWLSGFDNLRALLYVNKGDLADADLRRALDRCGLGDDAGRKVTEYSQGMRQRLGLACATAGAPDVLILDEPSNGLDPLGAVAFREILRSEADRGCAVLLSSHLLSEAEKACDRFVVIDRGQVVASGDAGSFGALREQIEVRVGVDELDRASEALHYFTVSREANDTLLVTGGSGRGVSAALLSAGIFPETVRPLAPSLEDLFLELTRRPDA